ncbi:MULTISPECIES: uracil-DNA glycosylase family protein [unclassified Acinetobacter]|uniref:uracil-DNA glycosylase family protein n=1 Tax=unclassified Acinetobacter TaxID=196816 RepID=UPI002448EB50|nr:MULTISPECIES: uracil-DNA glycosylase family protein [unclassified Acinetobacter]MDH0030299.1 uracil-DNA glycosylase family protein [Acinetobacter sp. GD04021]MDH0885867.1 uracil-DNA glycosylase family protein [Acinetobacter sp. GD03873]MDH1082487.1 uracil-DNA glycosylase family protein [Acinetobacter sp. GD03983]MDH2189121.1 uracil-DNA glycosylase family protein [Acinetobacter sp. GD03645]MDH2202309.1 uracil-DNA glycosylase family protein [Acinetobacter sp. GD03647]
MSDINIETHPLTPFLPGNAKLLMLGSFPPPQNRWKMNFYYPNYQNDMWRIFGLIFFSDKNHFLDLPNKNFKESQIREFLSQIGIGIFDTAYQIKRLQGNASDKFLEIVTPTDLSALLEQIPMCHTIMTTGDKATDTLMQHFPDQPIKPMIGQSVQVNYDNRELSLYRLPSSSRAYPLALEKKADVYKQFFQQIGLV